MTNDDWSKLVDTSDEWIVTRTGIRERHFAAPGEATSDMVAEASRRALEDAGIDKGEIDIIIVATVTPDNPYPSTANWVQKKLGMQAIPAFDISAGCTGFLYGTILAHSFIQSGMARKVMVAGSDILTRVMDWEDRNSCVLFGDGAGVVIYGEGEAPKGILSTYWSGDGNLGDLLIQPGGGSAMPASAESVANKKHTIHMKGNEVFKHAVLRMQESAFKALELAGLNGEDIDLFIPHQANIRIIEATIKRANIPLEKTVINIQHTGNMSAATIPVALDQARREGRLPENSNLLMAAFGAGFTWAAVLVRV